MLYFRISVLCMLHVHVTTCRYMVIASHVVTHRFNHMLLHVDFISCHYILVYSHVVTRSCKHMLLHSEFVTCLNIDLITPCYKMV